MFYNKIIRPNTILGIPGNWSDKTAILAAIEATHPDKFIIKDNFMINLNTWDRYQIAIQNRDLRIKESFLMTSDLDQYPYIDEDQLDEIDTHTFIVYIIGKTGSCERAFEMAKAGNAILQAGGLGIKIESTGLAFIKESWTATLEHACTERETYVGDYLHGLFVHEPIREKETTYSRGMQNLGLRDTIIYGMEPAAAAELLTEFNGAQIMDNGCDGCGSIFGQQLHSTPLSRFRITEEPNQPHQGDELFENPYGMLRLTPE